MWFQHDGALVHFSIDVREHSRESIGQRWTGSGGSVSWPAKFLDLNPIEFISMGIFGDFSVHIEELQQRVEQGCHQI